MPNNQEEIAISIMAKLIQVKMDKTKCNHNRSCKRHRKSHCKAIEEGRFFCILIDVDQENGKRVDQRV